MRFAVVLCLLAITAPACDAPSAGPRLPAGAAWVDYTESAPGPYGCGTRPAIVAGTSIDDIRQKVVATCSRPSACTEPGGSCWQNQRDQPGYIYVAVLIMPVCTATTKDNMAASSNAIYFVRWVGHAQGVCNMMLALPPYRLFLVSRSGLHAGVVKVELQVQTEGAATETADTEVNLG